MNDDITECSLQSFWLRIKSKIIYVNFCHVWIFLILSKHTAIANEACMRIVQVRQMEGGSSLLQKFLFEFEDFVEEFVWLNSKETESAAAITVH